MTNVNKQQHAGQPTSLDATSSFHVKSTMLDIVIQRFLYAEEYTDVKFGMHLHDRGDCWQEPFWDQS
jgi:hypothetical protein